MRIAILFVALFLAPLASVSAQTVTARDIVELSKAGLGEEILLALIEVHGPVFPVDAVTLKGLKDAGVPPNVIIAMIKSGRQAPPPPPQPVVLEEPAPHPQPQVLVIEHEHHYEAPRVREVLLPVPVYVPVRTRSIRNHPSVGPVPGPVEPVYWGFGGKLRPDAWKPTAADVQKDANVPLAPQQK